MTSFHFIRLTCLFVQAALKYWLGLDHYITSFRQTLEGFDSTISALLGSTSPAGVVPGVKVSDITFAGVPVRVYEPPAGGEGHLRRGLMYFHGGGWAFGSGSEHRFVILCRINNDLLLQTY